MTTEWDPESPHQRDWLAVLEDKILEDLLAHKPWYYRALGWIQEHI